MSLPLRRAIQFLFHFQPLFLGPTSRLIGCQKSPNSALFVQAHSADTWTTARSPPNAARIRTLGARVRGASRVLLGAIRLASYGERVLQAFVVWIYQLEIYQLANLTRPMQKSIYTLKGDTYLEN